MSRGFAPPESTQDQAATASEVRDFRAYLAGLHVSRNTHPSSTSTRDRSIPESRTQ